MVGELNSGGIMNKIQPKYKKTSYMIFYFLVPAFLLLIYFLPYSIKQYLILDVSNPTLISIFFSNYTHSEFLHLVSNLIAYFILIFLLFKVEIYKKMFYKISLLNFIFLPFVVSLSTVYFLPRVPPAQGFSAVVSAFNGYLLYSKVGLGCAFVECFKQQCQFRGH